MGSALHQSHAEPAFPKSGSRFRSGGRPDLFFYICMRRSHIHTWICRRRVGIITVSRRKMKAAAVTALFSLAILLAAGCSDTERVDAATFLKYGEATRIVGSAAQYTLVGVKGDRAVIQYWTAVTLSGGSKTMFYWVPLSELPLPVVAALTAGKNPWAQTGQSLFKEENEANQPSQPTRPAGG